MTKTITLSAVSLFILAICASFVLSIRVYADSGDLRGRGSTGRTTDLTPPPPPPPSLLPPPPPPSGGITNVTSTTVNSGGNTGGSVTTGDEHADTHVVNIGPTNPPPPPPPATNPPPPPANPTPSCDGRTRTDGCTTSGRTR